MKLSVMDKMCETCPFHSAGWTEVRGLLEQRALTEASPYCHSTGSTALVKVKGKAKHGKAKVCRGARNFQLTIFHRLGILTEPTDAAWDKTWNRIKKHNGKKH